MSDEEEATFREMFPLVIGALIGIMILLIVVAIVLDTRDNGIYVPAGETREGVLRDRLAPIGQVQFGGPEEVAVAEEEEDPVDPRSGQEVYDQVCASCHDTGAAGSPLLDATDEWEQRLDERGFDGIVQSVIDGMGAMPARGGDSDATDDELEASVKYILEEAGVSW